MALTRKETTALKPEAKTTSQKDPSETTVSYQDQRSSRSKMGPVSSTVEGSK